MTTNQQKAGMLLAVIGGLVTLLISLRYFFEGELLSHLNYNRVDSYAGEVTIIGLILFLMALAIFVIALISYKQQSQRKWSLMLFSILLLLFIPFTESMMTLIGLLIASLLIFAGSLLR